MLRESHQTRWSRSWLVGIAIWLSVANQLIACPFCSAISNSLRQDVALADHVALAICVIPADVTTAVPMHQLRIKRVFQGDELWVGRRVEVCSFSPYATGDILLVLGGGQALQVDWGSVTTLKDKGREYIEEVMRRLAKEQNDWLPFFWENLISDDEWVRRDSFNEFAQASLEQLRTLVPDLDPDEVVRRLQDKKTSVSERRLYWTILSLCGRQSDQEHAQQAISRSLSGRAAGTDDVDVGLDAAISCWLMLGGESALARVETELLCNQKASYAARYAAIVAMRVHAAEFKLISNTRLTKAMSLVLADPAMADLVIPDLARLEDWSHVAQLLELYVQADSQRPFVRMPIVNYLRTCPLPEAKSALQECQRIDPETFRRASVVLPRPPTSTAP
jgi:hypothetical protein